MITKIRWQQDPAAQSLFKTSIFLTNLLTSRGKGSQRELCMQKVLQLMAIVKSHTMLQGEFTILFLLTNLWRGILIHFFRFTKAAFLNQVGKKTPLFLRFSTVAGERGANDCDRDPRGFAIKFYTEEGNYDMVGNNTPVFFVKDPIKFVDFIHS
jgi:hypothetical protein